MNAGRYGRSSSVLKELLALDPTNPEAKRLFATLQLRLGSLVTARNAFQALTTEALERQDYWLAESLLREYLAAGPRCVLFVEKLGSVFELKGDLDAAIEEYAKAVEILVEDPDSEQPDLAPQLMNRIAQLSPKNPVLLHLESLLQRVRERPREKVAADEDGGTSRFAPAMSGLDQPVTEVEFQIPPADASSDSERTRLPWEDEAEDILVPQQPAAVQDTGPPTPSWDTAEQPSPAAEIDTPQMAQDALMAGANIASPPDSTVQLPVTETTPPLTGAVLVQEELLPLSKSDPSSSVEHIIATIAREEVLRAENSENSVSSLSPSKDESEPPKTGPGGSAALDVKSNESRILTEIGVADGLKIQDLSSTGEQDIVSTGGGLTATEESPSVEILSRLDGSESDQSIGPVPPPMPWEQVEEACQEPAPANAESMLAAEEVNEELIAGILQQTDLRERLAGGSEGMTSKDMVDGSHISESAIRPEPEPSLDISDAEICLMPPAYEPVEESIPSTAFTDNPIGQPVETMSTVASVEQSSLPDLDPKLIVPQDTGADSHPAVESQADAPLETGQADLKETGSPTSTSLFTTSGEPKAPESIAHLSYPLEVASPDESLRPGIQEPLLESADSLSHEPVLSSGAVVEPQVESTHQPVLDSGGDAVGYSDQEVVETANPTASGRDEPEAALTSEERHLEFSEYEGKQSSSSKDEQSVQQIAWRTDTPPVPHERSAEPSVLSQDRLDTTDTGQEIREETPALLSRQEPIVSRSESERSVLSSPPSPSSAEITPQCDEPLSSTPVPVVDSFKGSAAPADPSTNSTSTQRDARVQVTEARRPISVAGLSESTTRTSPRPAAATLSRFFFRIALFVRSCFATAHAMVVTLISLVIFALGCAVLLVGGLGLTWLGLEEKPNSAFHDLMGARPQSTEDPSRNGALLLLGFAAPDSKDPIQAGLAIQNERGDLASANGCLNMDDPAGASQTGRASPSTLASWYREDIPSWSFRNKAATLKEWSTGRSVSAARYQKWLTLPFDDVAYGQVATPDCRLILEVHRLFVAEGFAQGMDQGIERLETDLVAWRGLLRKARTLGTKLLAVTAVNDDARVVSGLLTISDLDARYLPRLAKLVSPMDGVEQSLRWPMQHEFLIEKKRFEVFLRADQPASRPWYITGITLMPLPSQRVLNGYAEYYEDMIKSVETARTMPTVPRLYSHVRTPAVRMTDYLLNPVNNILDVPSGPAWEQPIGQIRETDALLRLTSLQAWIRRGAPEGDVKTRVAKAGQNFYDPFTGYPMLINQANGRLYSVGANGKDDDAVSQKDVSVRIPALGTPNSLNAASASTASSK